MKIARTLSSDEYPDAIVVCFDDPNIPNKTLHPNDSLNVDGITIYFQGLKDGVAEFGISPRDIGNVRKSHNPFFGNSIDDSKINVPEQWIADATAIYGDEYDYTNAVYSGNTTALNEKTVLVKCRKHGQIEVGYSSHLGIDPVTGRRGFAPRGCRRCPSRRRASVTKPTALISRIESIFTGHGHYKLEFSCDSLPEEWGFLAGFRVAGGQYYRDQTKAFIKALPYSLLLERDSSNTHDPNAIRVIGISSTDHRYMIGHVPAEFAKRIVESECLDSIKAALHLAQISQSGYTFVDITIYGPDELRRLIEDPGVLALHDAEKQRRLLNEQRWEEERRKRAIEEEPLARARDLERAGKYPDAIAIYQEWLKHDSSSDVFDRISVCYGKLKDFRSVTLILDEYIKKREQAHYPCRRVLLDRLDRARLKTGLPKLDDAYRAKLLPGSDWMTFNPEEIKRMMEEYRSGR